MRSRRRDLLAQLREVEKQCTLLEGEPRALRSALQTEPAQPPGARGSRSTPACFRTGDPASQVQPANDAGAQASADPSKPEPSTPPSPPSKPENKPPSKPHGRRRLDASVPVHEGVLLPDEVRAAGGIGFIRIGEEVSERIAFRPASFILLRTILARFARVPALLEASSAPIAASLSAAESVAARDGRRQRDRGDHPRQVRHEPAAPSASSASRRDTAFICRAPRSVTGWPSRTGISIASWTR